MTNQEAMPYDAEVAARRTKRTWGGWRPGAGRKPRLKDPVGFSLELEKAHVDSLQEIARKRGTSMATLVREARGAYLKRRRRK